MIAFLKKKKENIQTIKKWDVEEQGKMRYIYTDIFNNKYYTLKDPTKISLKRSIAAESALRAAEFCITKEKLRELVQKAKDAILASDASTAIHILHEILIRSEYAAEENTLINLATVYVYLENEPIAQYADYWQEKKKELWKKDEDALNFFLLLAWNLTRQYSNMSDIDILTYLKSIKEIEEKMQTYFSHNPSKTTSMKSTS
jgi:hypothetical protein